MPGAAEAGGGSGQVVSGRKDLLYELALLASGLFLAGFMFAHETMLASAWGGADAMDSVARSLEATGLVGMGVAAVAAILLVHALVALRRLPLRWGEVRAFARTGASLRHWDTVSWGLQGASAVLIAVLASVHVATQWAGLPVEAAKSAARVNALAGTGFYDVFLLAVAVHVGLGLERVATKWGWPGRRAARAIALAIFVLFLLAGFATLIAFHGIFRGG